MITVVALALPAQSALADSAERSADELLARLRSLYREAGAATDAYNAAEERLQAQTARVERLADRLAATRKRLDAGRDDAGRLARRQYRGEVAVLPPYVRMLLSRDPHTALEHGHLMRRAATEQARVVDRLTSGERRLEELEEQARAALDEQRSLADRRREQRDTVRERVRRTERLLASMTRQERSRVRRLEHSRTDRAQRALRSSGTLRGSRTPSAAGARALRYALAQLGKPYIWGAQGPNGFDCSGLTSRAWAHAGRRIPRTSQGQWRQLRRVPLRRLRPGDLVIYFRGATHVALYAGDGRVVQAPRPGSAVKVSPLAANPVLGAVRPDPSAEPLAEYRPPSVPRSALAGDDTGYSAATGP